MSVSPAKIGLQLYTLREEIESDMRGTLEKVAEMGYAGVETAFFPEGVSLADAANMLDEVGLPVFACHCELPVGDKKEAMLELAEAFDCKRMVWHGWPEDTRYNSLDGTRRLIEIYNESSQFAASNGLEFGIHNHWWEFERKSDGHSPYQVLMDELSADVFFEIDTYWVKVAGHDPAAIVGQFAKRAPLLHIKDGPARFTPALDEDEPEPMVAVGQGAQDFPAIVEAAEGATDWMIVELDNCATDMLTAVQESYIFLSENGLGSGRV